jgi:23S rRNA pseudouridine1911/1915/1917 synthase
MLDELQEQEEIYFEHRKIPVDPAQSPLRLDKFLLLRLPATSRNRIQNLIKNGFVFINGNPEKPNYKVRPSDEIVIAMPEPPRSGEILPEKMDLNIVYEDDDLIIVNKPAGLVVHPATENWTGTLENGLRWHLAEQGIEYQGLVHRIDKDTTGLLVVPKTEEAKFHLAKQFFDHTIERTYYAIVWGEPVSDGGTITGNIGRSQNDRRIFVVYPDSDRGKHAVTHYQVLGRYRYISLVKCNLETGRTHQIRVHMKYLGHPLFSDSFYGGDKILKGTVFSKYRAFVENCFEIMPRQGLHAKTLGFIHPRTEKFVQFDSELPEDFRAVLERWQNYVKNH